VSNEGVTQLHFCEQGVKTRAFNYQSDISEKIVKPLSDTLFFGKNWTFQHDSTPAHKAKTTQR
jgi:hypothetical protein